MELIFYDEAARIIGVTVDTLKQAVSRGALTRAGRQGHNQRLIKEQVELFKGRQMSYKHLSAADKETWQRCASEASQGKAQTVGMAMAIIQDLPDEYKAGFLALGKLDEQIKRRKQGDGREVHEDTNFLDTLALLGKVVKPLFFTFLALCLIQQISKEELAETLRAMQQNESDIAQIEAIQAIVNDEETFEQLQKLAA